MNSKGHWKRPTAVGLAALLAGCWLVSEAGAGEPQTHYALVANTLAKHVIPHVTQLKETAAALPARVEAVCKTGDAAARDHLKAAFADVAKAWAGVEFLRFGPLAEAGRRERFSFWPDPRGITDRQLRQFLLGKDMTAIQGGNLAKQSAAIQGLPALERLMTDTEPPLGPGDDAKFHCAYATAIAGNLAAISSETADAWTKEGGWKDKMLRPGSDNDTYKEPAEAAADLLKSLLTGLQFIGDVELKPKLEAKDGNVPPGPFARLKLSSDYYAAGVASLHQLYDAMQIESYLPDDKLWIKDWAKGAWHAMEASDGAGGAGNGKKRVDTPPLREVVSRLGGLRQLLGKEMASAAGLSIGFNELDGD